MRRRRKNHKIYKKKKKERNQRKKNGKKKRIEGEEKSFILHGNGVFVELYNYQNNNIVCLTVCKNPFVS